MNAPPSRVVVVRTAPTVVVVRSPGPQGPRGVAGVAGVAGASAPPPQSHDLLAVSSWSLAHTFGYPPEVMLLDEAGSVVETGVDYPDADTVSITFPTPFTGRVLLY